MLALALSMLQVAAQGKMDPTVPAHHTAASEYSQLFGGVSLLVMVDGKIVHEEYSGPVVRNAGLGLASGTKSFVGVAAAFLVQEGEMEWDDEVSKFLEEWQGDTKKKDITIRELLNLTSGLPAAFGGSQPPSYEEAVDLDVNAERGEAFQYGPAAFQVFGEVLMRISGKDIVEYLDERLFGKIDAKPTHWRSGSDGHPLMPQGAVYNARSWANFGEFIRLGGKWDGEQILDAGLIDELMKGSKANPCYGLTWWLNRPIDDETRLSIGTMNTSFHFRYGAPGIPNDLVIAAGAGNQLLLVSRELKMVVVRQGGAGQLAPRIAGTFRKDEFVRLLTLGPRSEDGDDG